MENITTKISLDFARSLSPIVVFAKQFDNDLRVVEIEPLKNGTAYDVTGMKAKVAVMKSDGTQAIADATISSGKISVALNASMLSVAGRATATVTLLDRADISRAVSAQNFIIFVEESAFDTEGVENDEAYEGIFNEISEVRDELSSRIYAVERDVLALKIANEGNTYTFYTDDTTAQTKAVPSDALPVAFVEMVKGSSLASIYPIEILPAGLDSIILNGKNLLSPDFLDITKWTKVSANHFASDPLPFPTNGKYTVKGKFRTSANHYFYFDKSTNNGATWTESGIYFMTPNASSAKTITFDGSTLYRLHYYAGVADTIAEYADIYDMQMEFGEVATDYSPFIEPFKIVMPEDVRSLDGYGHGISDTVCNYIDFNKKQYVQMCALRSYENGDESKPDVITNPIWTQTLAPLDKPVVTDISEVLSFDGTIQVEQGGLIEFEFTGRGDVTQQDFTNADGLVAPTSIVYQIKL